MDFLSWWNSGPPVCVISYQYYAIVYVRYTTEKFPSLVRRSWCSNSITTQVWASHRATQQSLNVHIIHQMACLCYVKSAQAAATSSVCLAAGNEARYVTLCTMAGRVYCTTAWEDSDRDGSVSLVRRTSVQGKIQTVTALYHWSVVLQYKVRLRPWRLCIIGPLYFSTR